jgi:hypothetical protein
MIARRSLKRIVGTVILAALSACHSNGHTGAAPASSTPAVASPAGPAQGVPAPAGDATPPCVISADCPRGQYCELAQCVQSCSTETPCPNGETCMARGECVSPGSEESSEPEAVLAEAAGALQTLPSRVTLTEADKAFRVSIVSTWSHPLRYRVEVDGGFLRPIQTKGQLNTQLDLDVVVSPPADAGIHDGVVRIITEGGTVSVPVSLSVGFSGVYSGNVSYGDAAGQLLFGSAALQIGFQDNGRDLRGQIDERHSLLYPKRVVGSGRYTSGDGLVDITFVQLVPRSGTDFALIDRSILRTTRILAHRGRSADSLVGTVTETIEGLFSSPVQLTGDIQLRRVGALAQPIGEAAPAPALPTFDTNFTGPGALASSASGATCYELAGLCEPCLAPGASCASVAAAVTSAVSTCAQGYEQDGSVAAGKGLFDNLASACIDAVESPPSPPALPSSAAGCAYPEGLACLMPVIAARADADKRYELAFIESYAALLGSHVAAGSQRLTEAIRASFSRKLGDEAEAYRDVASRLVAPVRWALQAGALEYLRGVSPGSAQGSAGVACPITLGLGEAVRLFVESHLESARLEQLASAQGPDDARIGLQQTSLDMFFAGIAMSDLSQRWALTNDVGLFRFAGLLDTMQDTFAGSSLVNGAFGISPEYVPFLFRGDAASMGVSNFDQVLGLAHNSVALYETLEKSVQDDARTYEQNRHSLDQELETLNQGLTSRIASICGANFSFAEASPDWTQCGSGGGEVDVLALQLQAAEKRVLEAQSRLAAAGEKIQIDVQTAARVLNIRMEDVAFIAQTGEAIAVLTFATGVIDGATKALSTASNAQLFNGFSGVPLGAAILILDIIKAGLDAQKSLLGTVQAMHSATSNADVEYTNAMASVQKQLLDLSQLAIEIDAEILTAAQTRVQLANLVSEGQRVFGERALVAKRIEGDDAVNPAFARQRRDSRLTALLEARHAAQQQVMLAGRALEYELGTALPQLDTAVMATRSSVGFDATLQCMQTIFDRGETAIGVPQRYTTTVSVRSLLGIDGTKKDEVTGESFTAGEQFRMLLKREANLDADGGVSVTFQSDLRAGGPMWSEAVCGDKVSGIQARLIGDSVGDNQAEVHVALAGSGLVRSCATDATIPYRLASSDGSLSPAAAVVQAGTNTNWGDSSINTSLFGQPVARTTWRVTIPSASTAPSNRDVSLDQLEDIELRVTHQASVRNSRSPAIYTGCLAAGL